MDLITETAPHFLSIDTVFSNYLLIFDPYSKIQINYGFFFVTEEVVDKLNMSQSRSGKIEKFGWWDLERVSEDAGYQFISTEFKDT